VATRAEVSPDTIYKVFGTKLGLLRALLQQAVGGDDADVPMLDREQPQAMRAELDQRRQVAMFAGGMTAQLERLRPIDDILASAAAVDPTAAQLRQHVQNDERREAMRTVAGWIAARGPLRDGLSRNDAGAAMWALTSPEVHRMLRDVNGWSAKRYQRWLTETLMASLLPPADPPS
jgi:AcrR family transcriptional regulator